MMTAIRRPSKPRSAGCCPPAELEPCVVCLGTEHRDVGEPIPRDRSPPSATRGTSRPTPPTGPTTSTTGTGFRPALGADPRRLRARPAAAARF